MYAQIVLGTPLWRLRGPPMPYMVLVRLWTREVYTPLVSSPERKNWRECNLDMIY
jgi:hypothetical protein